MCQCRAVVLLDHRLHDHQAMQTPRAFFLSVCACILKSTVARMDRSGSIDDWGGRVWLAKRYINSDCAHVKQMLSVDITHIIPARSLSRRVQLVSLVSWMSLHYVLFVTCQSDKLDLLLSFLRRILRVYVHGRGIAQALPSLPGVVHGSIRSHWRSCALPVRYPIVIVSFSA